ncbi:four helix bundle protein [Flavobacterium sp. HJ-32-4]|nr:MULTISPECIES: four helix bundle protein [unclassified Flavobacterium]UMY67223.1 four helix bundle protein [Flavobacterium sp. HJ-32-4]
MNYTELEVWTEARKLTTVIYRLTTVFPSEERFGLVSQMRRSTISILSNIAEGCGRRTNKDTLHFLHMARGSLYELEAQCFVALDLGFMGNEGFNSARAQILLIKRLLSGFIKYFRNFQSADRGPNPKP